MSEHIVKVLQRNQPSHSQSDIKHVIYIHSKWLEQTTELLFLLTSSNTVYNATLQHDEIKSAAEDLDQPFNRFYEECRQALTTQMGLSGFDYEIDEQETMFKLRKCIRFEPLYINIPLRKVSNCYQMLDVAIECIQRSACETETKSRAEPSTTQSNELLEEYEKYIRDSKLAEKRLLKKFLMLINSKKERIEELEGKLERQRNDRPASDSDADDVEEQRVSNNDTDDNDDDDDVYKCPTQALTEKEKMQE